jgi:ABC-type transport system substrate-binding protein
MKTKLFVAIVTITMLGMMLCPTHAWNYGNPAIPADNNVEYFGPRADKLLIPLYASQTSEWDTGLMLGKIDVTDWPLDDTHYTAYTTPPYNNSIMVTPYGPETGIRLFDLNQNNNTYLGNPPDSRYPQPADVYFAGGYGNPMAELSLRKAVAYLSDRAKYVQNCGVVTNIPVYTVLGANDLGTSPWGKYTDWDITAHGSRSDLCYLYNVTAASAVLNASGNFPLLPGHTWRQYTPNPAHLAPMDFQLIFYVRTDDPCREYAGDQLTAQLEQSGIQINVKEVGCNITGAHDNVMGAKDFHLYTGGSSFPTVPDQILILWDWAYYWHPGRPYNYAGCNDPTVNVAAESCYSANTQADAVSWAIQFQVAFATGVLAVPLWMAAGSKAESRTYTGGTNGVPVTPDDGENQYRGQYWVGFVNIAGGGTDNYFSFLNMHPEGYDWGNDSMTIRYGFKTASLQELNPIYSESTWDNMVIDLVGYDSLVMRNPLNLGQYDPWTCLTFNVTTYIHPVYGLCTKVIYTLRDDVYFQDGVPVTAADMYFTFVEMKGLLAARGFADPWWISNVQDILGLDILDPYNIEVLYDVKSIFAVYWAGLNRILPKHIWYPIVSTGDPTVPEPDPNLIGLGPWRLAEYASRSHIELLANKPGSNIKEASPLAEKARQVDSTEGYHADLQVEAHGRAESSNGMTDIHKLQYPFTGTLETVLYNAMAGHVVSANSTISVNGTKVFQTDTTYSINAGGGGRQ